MKSLKLIRAALETALKNASALRYMDDVDEIDEALAALEQLETPARDREVPEDRIESILAAFEFENTGAWRKRADVIAALNNIPDLVGEALCHLDHQGEKNIDAARPVLVDLLDRFEALFPAPNWRDAEKEAADPQPPKGEGA